MPTATTPFESTSRPSTFDFFGRPQQLFFAEFFSLGIDLFHGDAAFKPVDWRIKITPVSNVNALALNELGMVSPSVTQGTTRYRTFTTLQEWFFEYKIADLSPNYDFLSVRAGSQPFTSDFRGFVFTDTNRAVRLFGTTDSGRDEFNVALFAQREKDTNSFLNTFNNRHQMVGIANYYIQDFLFPGYTTQFSVVYDHDGPRSSLTRTASWSGRNRRAFSLPTRSTRSTLAGPATATSAAYNITHAFYWVFGHDTLNPLANQPQDINAQLAAIELSYDRDWVAFATSFFYSSGDGNPNNSHATGFRHHPRQSELRRRPVQLLAAPGHPAVRAPT